MSQDKRMKVILLGDEGARFACCFTFRCSAVTTRVFFFALFRSVQTCSNACHNKRTQEITTTPSFSLHFFVCLFVCFLRTGVGKTSILNRFVSGSFSTESPTTGLSCHATSLRPNRRYVVVVVAGGSSKLVVTRVFNS